jgi:aminopeptidase N
MTRLQRLLVFLVLLPAFFAAGQTPSADIFQRPEHFERSRDYDALHYRLAFRFDVPRKTVWGENTVTLSALKDDLSRIALDAVDFEVTAVADAAGAPLKFERTATELVVLPGRPLSYGEICTFTVKYVINEPKAGIKFVPESADSPAQINTYSWPEDARRWFPCFDAPDDKVTDELIATVPVGDRVLSNGRLAEVTEDKAAGTQTFHWFMDQPLPTYNIMMAVGPFEVIRDRRGDLPVDYWVDKNDVPDAPRSFRKTPRMIDFYARTFGVDYPWAKYDQICYAGYGGGMEATSATMLGRSMIHDARADQDFPSDGLVAHELAHQWWGDLITERDWADVWLSESFATYAEYLWTRFDQGEDEGALNLLDKKNAYLGEARTRYMRPLVFNRYNNPWDIMDSHSYPKGAAILHMLRFVMGDGPFFRALKQFLTAYAYQSVDTHDLMRTIKEATGQNMDWFFEQWVYKAGHPVFDVSWSWDEPAGRVKVKVIQTQDTSKGVPIYRTPVVIGLVLGDRVVSERVWISKKEETFSLPADSRPFLVRFDEGNWLLKEAVVARSTEELLFQVKGDDALGRLGAAGELAVRLDAPGVATALSERAKADPFWAVRKAALESLAKDKSPAAFAPLFKDRCLDASSKVRAAALRALGGLKDRRLVPYFEERFAKDDSYVAQSEALAGIGKSGDASAAAFLKKAAETPSPRNMLRRSAEAALRAVGAVPPAKP